ncbi:pyruvate dehydrogenase E1 component [Solirubrobacter pauli]|uniref:Pyruvate dehydrogenase E1 component n=1 Tax=Solirubrobacter pauli TaxID=166793 RepID=A0A660LK65_9ACTN|nr:1-deoxy-D-xylulose-5-phosphate synthase N-terminal domain-containing protein [Solirubrobacter pauli]RKQ93601.1 pyruvate dehydrogenase E1 component [Solirubrobacter pauli]
MTEEIDLEALKRVEQRVLWLATSIVHHANRVRPNRSGVKVGGHQASSASMVSLMTALYFAVLESPDRVSVKPHASPVLHAINHLLGRLDRRYLTTLRQYGGLQSYPSRTKDPDPVDYSTGSVGLGATAPIWGALAHRYVAGHFDVPRGGRQIALIGDAELDEGACWEAIADPMVSRLGEVMWVVDLNRQSLDRVVPDIAAGRLAAMFEAAGWHTVMVKYGPRLARRHDLRARIDGMPNEEYQRLLRADAPELRRRLEVDTDDLGDADLLATFRDLGGHDLASLIDGYRQADAVVDRPSVVFAYTIKGWSLPTEGHPANHSALLNHEQYRELATKLGEDADDPFRALAPGSPEAELCRATGARLKRGSTRAVPAPKVPQDLGRKHTGRASTQQAFGRFFVDLTREAPEVADRVVTVSPDVGTSTNLGGWINKAGIWSVGDRIDWFADDTDTLVRWREHDHGRHIELGIAEVNLVGMLGELGATWSRDGQPLLPVGTIYDPFVSRALEPWSFGIYAGGQSILVGTPSGVTLGPEGGAHQSVITPSIGIEQPGCIAYEPAFGQDFEWCFLHALSQLGKPGGTSAYFRLSTRPIDQSLHTGTREEAIAGGYRLKAHANPRVSIAVMGALVPEALEAAEILGDAEVVCITSADRLFRSHQARSGLGDGNPDTLTSLFRPGVPIVSLLDGHPHTLSFLGSPITCLGVQRFGQAGDIVDLYEHHEIDAESVVGAALDLMS